uniref:Uncharacterized protein n=1 Tax=Ovis aries TaxID=9940 RepID=A0AC11EKD4_SHEEP
MQNAGLGKSQAGIKIARRNIHNLRYADDITLMVKSKEKLKSLLIRMKEESEKVGLKFSFQKTRIMASRLITSWQIDGETVTDFISFFLPFWVMTALSPSTPGFSVAESWWSALRILCWQVLSVCYPAGGVIWAPSQARIKLP